MGNALETVAKAVRKVIGREDLPARGSDVLGLLLGDTVSSKIPHLGVAVGDVLLHAEEGRLGLVFSIVHVLELLKVGSDILLGVLAAVSGTLLTLLSSTLELDLGFVAVAYIGLVLLDQFLGEFVKLLEVVARVCDGAGGEAWRVSV